MNAKVWGDLWEAAAAIQPGDPPLRWTVQQEKHDSVRVNLQHRCQRMGMEIRTHYIDGELWVVRLK